MSLCLQTSGTGLSGLGGAKSDTLQHYEPIYYNIDYTLLMSECSRFHS